MPTLQKKKYTDVKTNLLKHESTDKALSNVHIEEEVINETEDKAKI